MLYKIKVYLIKKMYNKWLKFWNSRLDYPLERLIQSMGAQRLTKSYLNKKLLPLHFDFNINIRNGFSFNFIYRHRLDYKSILNGTGINNKFRLHYKNLNIFQYYYIAIIQRILFKILLSLNYLEYGRLYNDLIKIEKTYIQDDNFNEELTHYGAYDEILYKDE